MLDERGTVLLAVRGLQLGTGASESVNRDRVLNERLLTIEWKQRTLPDVEHVGLGTYLLISTSATADVLATRLPDALKIEGARCATMTWPQHADHQANTEVLGMHLAEQVSGMVILTGPKNGTRRRSVPCAAGTMCVT